MNLAGEAGLWMLVLGAIAMVIEFVVLGLRGFLLTKRLRKLNLRVEGELRNVDEELASLRNAASETSRLLQPYRRIRRWIRHPLALALYQSYRTRRSRNGSSRRSAEATSLSRLGR